MATETRPVVRTRVRRCPGGRLLEATLRSLFGQLGTFVRAEAERFPVPRRLVFFAIEIEGQEGTGKAYGIHCNVRPTTIASNSSSICDGSMVLATLRPTCEGAFRVAMSWMVGLVQAGDLREAAMRFARLEARQRMLWKVRAETANQKIHLLCLMSSSKGGGGENRGEAWLRRSRCVTWAGG